MKRDVKALAKRKKRQDAAQQARDSKPVVAKKKKWASTPNGQMIQDLMDANQVRGSYKDFVAITGSRLVDWAGAWDVTGPSGGLISFSHPHVRLLHKSRLKKLFGSPFADRLWHPQFGSLVQPSPKIVAEGGK